MLRFKQWVKNFFVLAALVFSKQLLDPAYAVPAFAAFVIFCGLSGAVYAFNDLLDVESDRKHPLKCKRPIASGELGERTALLMSIGLAACGLGASLLIDPMLALVAGGYLVNNLAYTLYLKRIAYLDVLMIGVGFCLRVLAGGFAIDVPVSTWLLVCTALLACFLGFQENARMNCSPQKRPDARPRKPAKRSVATRSKPCSSCSLFSHRTIPANRPVARDSGEPYRRDIAGLALPAQHWSLGHQRFCDHLRPLSSRCAFPS